tara:strand:+ start:559 stop:762 length:204 start_codon:yes stop_codon:yes gene_type:complete
MTECPEVQKSQMVRLVDVFVIAPFLFYLAFKGSGMAMWERTALYVLAVATLVYNAENYIETKALYEK